MSVDAQNELDFSPQVMSGQVEDKTVYLILGERSFPCRRVGVSWHMMQFGHAQRKAQRIRTPHADVADPNDVSKKIPCACGQCKKAQSERTDAGMEMMNAMRALILKILKPEVKEDFVDFMDEAELEPNELEEAIGNVIGRLGGQDPDKGKA